MCPEHAMVAASISATRGEQQSCYLATGQPDLRVYAIYV